MSLIVENASFDGIEQSVAPFIFGMLRKPYNPAAEVTQIFDRLLKEV
jgi:hypothetical protein